MTTRDKEKEEARRRSMEYHRERTEFWERYNRHRQPTVTPEAKDGLREGLVDGPEEPALMTVGDAYAMEESGES